MYYSTLYYTAVSLDKSLSSLSDIKAHEWHLLRKGLARRRHLLDRSLAARDRILRARLLRLALGQVLVTSLHALQTPSWTKFRLDSS